MARSYFHPATETLVKINGDDFVILGNEDNVSDDAIMALYEGKLPKGWEVAP
jgi:hypothetical protein